MRHIVILAAIDLKSALRDPLLRWMLLYPLLLCALVRLAVPWAAEIFRSRHGIALEPYYPMLMAFVLASLPMAYGMVTGFLLLDQRDDRTLSALQVTPMGLSGYLAYRLAMPALLGLVAGFLLLPATGLAGMGSGGLLAASLAATPLAPLYALLLGALAGNKVQGFALTKAAGALTALPMLAYFVREPWQWLFGLVPSFWPAKLYWILAGGGEDAAAAVAVFAAALLVQGGCIAALLMRFRSVSVA